MFVEEMETSKEQFTKIIKRFWDLEEFEINLLNTIHYSMRGEYTPENKRFIIEILCTNKEKHDEMMRFCKIIGVDMNALCERRDKFF